MKEVVAGLTAGLVMGMVFIGAGAAMLPTLNLERLIRRLPEGTSLSLLGIVLALFIPLVWSLLGMIAGLFYLTVTNLVPGSGLGSPNLAFTLTVLAFSAAIALIPFLNQNRRLWQWLALSLSFAATFGWLLPYLAR
ncbi:MAG: hypothetical protein HY664_05135 [Chloroflexi bacterium]|nr:hypothetical protein [Chloroflexota bacterium]